MIGSIPSLRQADTRYPWPPKQSSVNALPKELLAGKYPKFSADILYDAETGVALGTYTKYDATPELLQQAQAILTTHGDVLCYDVVYLERMLEVPLARLAVLTPTGEEGYRDQEFNKALTVSSGVKGVGVGTLLRCMGGDGYGWYVVTRATARTVDVAYRGFGADDWRDRCMESLGCKKVPVTYAKPLAYRAVGLPSLKPLLPLPSRAGHQQAEALDATASAADNAMRAAMESPD